MMASVAERPSAEPQTETASESGRKHSGLVRIERALRGCVELIAVTALLAEVVLLLTGIIARSVFHSPIIWTEELATTAFLWLGMLGTVIALQRGEQMRLTHLVLKLRPALRSYAEMLAVGAPMLFLGLLLYPAIEYAQDQGIVETPALGWPGSIRALAVPVGCGLGMLACALRAARRPTECVVAAAVLLCVAAALCCLAPWLSQIGNWNLLFFFVLLLGIGILAGTPIAFAFGLATVAYLLLETDSPLPIIVGRLDEGMSSLLLLAIPLFILLGQLIEITGMARVMVEFLATILSHVRGGLSYVLLGAMLLISGISGSKTADMAAVAPVLFPEMRRRGAKDSDLISLLAASGAMSETIPPSIVLIAISSVTGVSIAALFTAGILPGLLLALALAVVVYCGARREPAQTTARKSKREVGTALLVALPALLLPVIIRAAVVEGIATATEVSTLGIVYTLAVGIPFYRTTDWRRIYPMLVQTVSLSGAILIIIGTATSMAWALTQAGFSQALADSVAHIPGGVASFLVASIVVFIVLGSVLEGIPVIVLFGPLFFPIAREMGVHEVHYAIVVILAMGIGLFAPPFGLGYYAACAVGRTSPDAAMRRIWVYLAALFVGLLIIAAVPWFSTGLL
jgi:tripartite ATP-independent transporter DctM subunit